eukprot:TRINITY_DN43466_c0_g1_i1.p1 TRINITY_DN43466_c0_g1~~TRINITY_DN43466_c0_g1_i1.p1  ORF type:complete len:174 (+),score=21.59 TRINITY_DN43466_c0_g1_i1:72-593(+)
MPQDLSMIRRARSSRNMFEMLKDASSWLAAGAVAMWFLKWKAGDTRFVDRQTIADVDAAEFELMQARTNSLVKAKDRASAPSPEEHTSLLNQAIRQQTNTLDSKYDYVSDKMNVINEKGILSTDLHHEARVRAEYMSKHGSTDFAEDKARFQQNIRSYGKMKEMQEEESMLTK